ncbi:hypothetical protein CY35_16G032600 [Sphagnum magellanicum]|nr:hypothetical protein CY35_16G032600 [Sphagnum magellanicum]
MPDRLGCRRYFSASELFDHQHTKNSILLVSESTNSMSVSSAIPAAQDLRYSPAALPLVSSSSHGGNNMQESHHELSRDFQDVCNTSLDSASTYSCLRGQSSSQLMGSSAAAGTETKPVEEEDTSCSACHELLVTRSSSTARPAKMSSTHELLQSSRPIPTPARPPRMGLRSVRNPGSSSARMQAVVKTEEYSSSSNGSQKFSTTTAAGAAAATRSQRPLLTRRGNSSSSVTRLESQLPRRSSSGTSPIHGATAAAHATDEDQLRRSTKQQQQQQQKRTVLVSLVGNNGGGRSSNEAHVPAADLWAWRKYGQKPIKGSPFPRGYYRCSSNKGCLARKQVERSRNDPSMLIVSYTAEHNHPQPSHRNLLAGCTRVTFSGKEAKASAQSCSSTTLEKQRPSDTATELKSDSKEPAAVQYHDHSNHELRGQQWEGFTNGVNHKSQPDDIVSIHNDKLFAAIPSSFSTSCTPYGVESSSQELHETPLVNVVSLGKLQQIAIVQSYVESHDHLMLESLSGSSVKDEDFFAELEELPDSSSMTSFACGSFLEDPSDEGVVGITVVDPYNLFSWSSISSLESKAAI